MPKFAAKFEIIGTKEVEAATLEEAEAMFDRLTQEEWSKGGELTTFIPYLVPSEESEK